MTTQQQYVFGRFSHLKKQYTLPLKVQDLLQYMENTIRHDSKRGSFMVCSSSKKLNVQPQYSRAFNTLTKEQQIALFSTYVDFLQNYYTNKPLPVYNPKQPNYIFDVLVREGTISHSWKSHKVQIDCQTLKASLVGNSRFNIDLKQFLIRRSKNTDKECFVLEATRGNLRKTLRIGFDRQEEYKKCYEVIKMLVRKGQMGELEGKLRCYEEVTREGVGKRGLRGEESKVVEVVGKGRMEEREVGKGKGKGEREAGKGEIGEEGKQNQQAEESQALRRETTIVDELIEEKEQIDLIEKIYNENDMVQQLKSKTQRKILEKQEPPLKKQFSKQHIQSFEQIKRKKDLDIFHKILPDYDLSVLDQQDSFRLIKTLGNFRLLKHSARVFMYRLTGLLPFPLHLVLSGLLDTSKYKQWNEQIQLGDLKIRIISQNSAIMYQKHKPYNKFYRARDYLYLRHVFVQGNSHYIVDKTIENAHYPPFSHVIRGVIKGCVWRLKGKGGGSHGNGNRNETELTMEIDIMHEGFLTAEQQQELTVRYLVGVTNIEGYLRQNEGGVKTIDKCFDLEWDIGRNSLNQSMMTGRNKRRKSVAFADQDNSEFTHNLCSQIESQRYYTARGDECWQGITEKQQKQFLEFQDIPKYVSSIPELKEQNKEIQEPSLQPIIDVRADCDLTPEGLVILPQMYITKKHKLKPVDAEYKPIQYAPYENFVIKNQWLLNHEIGLIFINQKKIEVQKGILKYILSKLGKNILAGKGITNISLPVDIFAPQSYLQRTARCMGYGPKILQLACKSQDSLTRMKHVIAFSISNSLGFVDMQKPFNPILGETFQGWLNGCPIYCQQLSHHPPITAFYLVGRGYRIYGNFQAKMELSINSGTGTNTGIYTVEFDDTHQKVHFMSPGGEVSGLTYGDRTFNFANKALFFDYENNRFCELVMNPTKKSFFSFGKQQKQADYCQGNIVIPKPQWLEQFRKSPHKHTGPSFKHTLQILSKVSGLWTHSIVIDGEQFYNVKSGVPCIIEYQKFPLNSNSNYREDIIYLKANDLTRAQVEKERLENVQRGDRKLREKMYGKGSKKNMGH